MGIARYADGWRASRKASQAILTAQAADEHLPIQKAEVTQLIYDIMKTPEVCSNASITIFISSLFF